MEIANLEKVWHVYASIWIRRISLNFGFRERAVFCENPLGVIRVRLLPPPRAISRRLIACAYRTSAKIVCLRRQILPLRIPCTLAVFL